MQSLRPHPGLLNQNFNRISGWCASGESLRSTALGNHKLLLFVRRIFTAFIFEVCLQKPHQTPQNSHDEAHILGILIKGNWVRGEKGAWWGTGDDVCHREFGHSRVHTAVVSQLVCDAGIPPWDHISLLPPELVKWLGSRVPLAQDDAFGRCQVFFERKETDFYAGIFQPWLMLFYLFWPPLVFNYKIMQFGMRLWAPHCAKFNWTHFSLVSWHGVGFKVKNQLPCSQFLILPFVLGRHGFLSRSADCCCSGHRLHSPLSDGLLRKLTSFDRDEMDETELLSGRWLWISVFLGVWVLPRKGT